MAGKVYQYDSRGRLVEVAGAQFTVNMLGERVAKTYQGTTTLFHYDQWGRLIAETDANGAVKREYLYLGNLPVALVDLGSDIRYIHTDHLGTPRLVSDALKHPVWAWQGEPFGATPANVDPEDSGAAYTFNLRFPGQYFDKETGHHYNYFRDYDPQNGRYVQSDPIGLAGGINTYAYVGGNPASCIDPKGLAGVLPGPIPLPFPIRTPWKPNDPLEDLLNTRPTYSSSSSSTGCNLDKAGRKISPAAQTMQAPGNCTPKDQQDLQSIVDKACSQPRSCRGVTDPIQAIIRREANRECALARNKINNKCFAGGDLTHRNEAIKAFNALTDCESIIP